MFDQITSKHYFTYFQHHLKRDISVHSMPSSTIIPAGKLINLHYKVNLSNTNRQTEEFELPERLKTIDVIILLKSGPNHRIKISVLNKPRHDLTLP